ncbi:A-kinase anchor protein 12 isoform X2 [Archocentrus centrarchus]|uniref:A-kinase anchor protein 12 isoform X2 n=1 Tax=Archocentrus centrarchus TaxID=63155 RepID=UPI0011E9B7DB|nr:A-kinase anchor protein 12-like isoform X2 [Archocentrus centrarchus]
MGDTQSAQRAGKDAAAEEESEKVNDGQTVQNTEDEPLKNNGQISEINGKADGSIAALNGHCEDKIPAEGNVAETEKLLKEEEETPLKNVEISQNKLPDEVDANEVEPAEIIEMEEKQNDINESFRKFFSNIGLKLTVKKGSGENGETDVPKEGPNIPEEVTDNVQEVKSENEEQNVALNAAQEANDYDSTTCPTMTDGTSENFLGNAETKTTETTEEAESDSADAGTTSPAVSEDAHQDTIPEEEPRPKSPLITDEIVVESPFKRFFTTGIFSSLRKKKKLAEDEAIEKELVDMGENEPAEIAEQAFEEEQQDKEEITLDTEAITTAKGLREAELLPAVSIQVKDEVKSPSMDTSDSIVNEAEILNSQEKEKVQASPLKKLMSGSSFKNLSKKQKGKKSSDAKISDPQQQISDQLLSSTDSAEYQKEESPTQPSAPAAEDEDGAWATFKKLVTPKKRIKKSSLSNEQGQISGSVDEAKLSEEQQISDHSTDEGKKRKDSSVSWEAVLCGSGRRRSRKSSDSEEETPQTSAGDSKQDSGLKQGAESPLERSIEVQKIQEGSPSEGDGESTWKSFKKLVTPKTKAKDEDESKDTSPSDDQVTQADSTFSIKKLLPGRKKRKPAEKPDQVSSDEADKDVASGDEDSETPAVIPLSEFDADETEVHTQTKTGVESYVPEETDSELRQESAPPCDSLQIETQKVLDNEDALENEASTTPVEENTVEEPDDLTELISKYQQLSDIPEEGILTETMATPASVIEEAARDDTIAEDLVEITSEAITAPEPVDATATDETEMISAVSQLSDSSKTSGNITPVPAEYSVKDTELLLEQVAENISASPHTVTVTSEEPSSERIVSSALPQILETFEKEQPKILEIHKGSDEAVINTDLNTEPIDVINELAATVQTESVPDVNKAISTEIVSQVHTEEFDNAEITIDEAHEVSVIQGQENIKELEATDDSQHVPESVSEEKEELPQETSPEGKEVVPDAGSLVGADQVEEDTLKTETQEAESASFEADENKNGSMEQEAQTPAEKRDQIIQIVTEESQVEDHASVVVVDELEAPTNVEKDAIASENDSVQSLEKETPSSEDIPPADVVTDESKQREHLNEVTVEPENTETQTEAPQIDHYEVTDVLEVEQKATVDTEEDSGQLPKEEVRSSEDIPPVESTDESKQRAEYLTEVTDEPETKEPHPDISEVTDVSEVVQATLESEGDHVQKEIQSSEDIHSAEPITDESKQTAEHLPEVTDEFQNKEPQVEVPEEIDVQAATLYPEERSIQSLDKEVISEDIPPAETDQPKETEMVPLTEDKVEAVDDSKTEDVQEPAVVQAFTLDSEEDSVQKEIKSSEDIPPAESIDESKQTAEHLTTVIDEIQNKEPQVEVPEEMEVVQAATFDSEERSIQSLDKEEEEDIPPPKTDQPKEAEMVPLTEDKVEAVDDSKTEDVKEPAVVQAITDSEAGSSQVIEEEVISKDMVVAETVTNEPRQETVELEKVELVEAEISLPDIVPETDDKISKANVFAQSIEEICTQELETETLLEDVPKLDTDSVTDETEKKVEAQPDQDLEINKDKKTESIPQGVRAEHEDRKAEAVEKTVTAAHVPSGAEASHDQVLEKTVFCEEILAPCAESAEVSEEPKHEEDLSIDQVSVEGEKADELQGTEMNTAAAEHAVEMQVITCNLKDVSAAIPDVLIEETPEIQERSIERNANEMEVKAPVETTTPLEKDNVNAMQRVESEKQIELMEAAVQTTEITEPGAVISYQPKLQDGAVQKIETTQPVKQIEPIIPRNREAETAEPVKQITEPAEKADLTERAVMSYQPVPQDIGIQAMETIEPVEQIQSEQSIIPIIQAAEIIEPVRPKEKRGVLLSHPAVFEPFFEAHHKGKKAEEPIKQTDEENDDVWLDAEEDIYTQEETEVSRLKVEEPTEPQAESEPEFEMAPDSKTEDGESHQRVRKTGRTCELESEGEDFAVALEYPETTISVPPVEWD